MVILLEMETAVLSWIKSLVKDDDAVAFAHGIAGRSRARIVEVRHMVEQRHRGFPRRHFQARRPGNAGIVEGEASPMLQNRHD